MSVSNDVSNKILSENPNPFFTHCFGHALNLAVVDIVKNVRFLNKNIETTYKISNLIKKSSENLQKTEEILNGKLHFLCSVIYQKHFKSLVLLFFKGKNC